MGSEMPDWDTHRRWTRRMGISDDVADQANRLADIPNALDEYNGTRYTVEGTKVTSYEDHDAARSRKTAAKRQVRLLKEKGSEFVEAFYLHHVLDGLHEKWPLGQHLEQILVDLEETLPARPERNRVWAFVREHESEIVEDIV